MLFRRKPKKPTDDVIIFRPLDRGATLLAWSILDGAGIRCAVDTDRVQDLIGMGRFGYGYNFATGPARISVMRKDAELAEAFLSDLRESKPSRPPTAVRVVAIIILAQSVIGLLATLANIVGRF